MEDKKKKTESEIISDLNWKLVVLQRELNYYKSKCENLISRNRKKTSELVKFIHI